MQKTGDENTQTYQVKDIILIEKQILITNSTRKCVVARGGNKKSDFGS